MKKQMARLGAELTSAAHKKLNSFFKQTRDLLRNSLDRLMLRLKRKEPDMAYFNARSQGNLYVETDGLGSGSGLVTE